MSTCSDEVKSDARGSKVSKVPTAIFVEYLFSVNSIEKTKMNQKRSGIAQF